MNNIDENEIQIGDPVILQDASEMHKFMLFDGCKGTANSITVVDGQELIMFQPKGMGKFFWLSANRFSLDVDEVERLLGDEDEE